MHRILSLIIATAGLSSVSRQAAAQDTITTRSGRQIPVAVQKIQGHRVSYLQISDGDTSNGWRDLHFVRYIRFADGRRWPYPAAEKRRISLQRQDAVNRKKNFSFMFIGMQVLGDYGGPAAGAGYERFVDRNQRWSIGANGSFFAMQEGGIGLHKIPASYTTLTGGYASPDIQFHGLRYRKRVALSAGIAVPLVMINRSDPLYARPRALPWNKGPAIFPGG